MEAFRTTAGTSIAFLGQLAYSSVSICHNPGRLNHRPVEDVGPFVTSAKDENRVQRSHKLHMRKGGLWRKGREQSGTRLTTPKHSNDDIPVGPQESSLVLQSP